jgi:hypothetical protein
MAGGCDGRAMVQGSRETIIHAYPDSSTSFLGLRGHALWLLVISIHAKSHETRAGVGIVAHLSFYERLLRGAPSAKRKPGVTRC